MSRNRFKRLFHSVFTRLLLIILAAGISITLTVVIGFSVIRFHHIAHLDRNLLLYAEYLIRDLGDPPDFKRAGEISRRTGMAMRFKHVAQGWWTEGFPAELPLERAWIRRHPNGISTGHLRGNMFIRIPHAGGELVFITPRRAAGHENAGWILLVMAVTLSAILAAAYVVIRRILSPLRTLEAGVEALGVGRLDHRVRLTGHDEFRDLSEAFNTMAGRLSDVLSNKERLLLDVSHELRSPLTRLKVQLELVEDKEIRQDLQADVNEMEAMVSTILEEARLRNTSAALQPEPTDMIRLIHIVVDEFKDRTPGIVCGTLDPATVMVDRDKMRMVLRNLVDNALKYTPEGGNPVEVSMARRDNHLHIVIEDHGVGIEGSDLPHLFDPFYRTDTSRSRKTGGYGLGLSLCKAVVDGHRGHIEINSTFGEGTRVTVALPVKEAV